MNRPGGGKVPTDWKIEGKTDTLEVIIPADAAALVELPFEGGVKEVGSGPHEIAVQVL